MSIFQIAGGIAFIMLGAAQIYPISERAYQIICGGACVVAGIALLIGR